MNREELARLAFEHDMEITALHEIEMLHVGRQHMYGQREPERAEEYLVSAATLSLVAIAIEILVFFALRR